VRTGLRLVYAANTAFVGERRAHPPGSPSRLRKQP